MQKQMVQCEDGRRREARIHGVAKEDGDFKVWQAGIRLKGKHVSGEAWYSYKTKTWHFLTNLEGKHSHLMGRIHETLREEAIKKLQAQLSILQGRHLIEQKQIEEHRKTRQVIETQMEALKQEISKLEKGAPLEASKPLEYSSKIRRA